MEWLNKILHGVIRTKRAPLVEIVDRDLLHPPVLGLSGVKDVIIKELSAAVPRPQPPRDRILASAPPALLDDLDAGIDMVRWPFSMLPITCHQQII